MSLKRGSCKPCRPSDHTRKKAKRVAVEEGSDAAELHPHPNRFLTNQLCIPYMEVKVEKRQHLQTDLRKLPFMKLLSASEWCSKRLSARSIPSFPLFSYRIGVKRKKVGFPNVDATLPDMEEEWDVNSVLQPEHRWCRELKTIKLFSPSVSETLLSRLFRSLLTDGWF